MSVIPDRPSLTVAELIKVLKVAPKDSFVVLAAELDGQFETVAMGGGTVEVKHCQTCLLSQDSQEVILA